jgi:hypothetical protein
LTADGLGGEEAILVRVRSGMTAGYVGTFVIISILINNEFQGQTSLSFPVAGRLVKRNRDLTHIFYR